MRLQWLISFRNGNSLTNVSFTTQRGQASKHISGNLISLTQRHHMLEPRVARVFETLMEPSKHNKY